MRPTLYSCLFIVLILGAVCVLCILFISACTIEEIPENQETSRVVVTYEPKQCETEPWNAWLANSDIRFFKAPTEQEVISMYYSNVHNITVSDFKRIQLGQLTCEACEVCIKGYMLQVEVDQKDVAQMVKDGWKKASASANTTNTTDTINTTDTTYSTGSTEIANPASKYCVGNGYRLEIRSAADGSQTGYCIFPDGKECEEWAFYRGECNST